jgi:hypothetical protein
VNDGAPDTYCMYLPELNSIQETRDVQWGKRMYFEPVRVDLIHAADLVELKANPQIVPMRMVASITPHQVQTQGGGTFQPKGPVTF